MNKNYNFECKKLNLPEYGRNILKMVEYLMTINDRELRNHQARVVIDVMGNINNHLRDTDDLKHKLWDHLFIISDFKLDVDSPYPKPSPSSITPSPEKLPYPQGNIGWNHYGRNIEIMIKVLKNTDNEEERRLIINNIAKYMRNKSHEFNQEHPSNEIIINDIRCMCDNMINIEDDILNGSKSEFKPQITNQRTKNKNNFKKQNPKNNFKSNNSTTRKTNFKKTR
ncbi:MAG: DUF4290 domain-containing protein [Rikenellaceae bacterium]|nr:DUF4290 domain-containing protein [Rikenellaceae bacterium]